MIRLGPPQVNGSKPFVRFGRVTASRPAVSGLPSSLAGAILAQWAVRPVGSSDRHPERSRVPERLIAIGDIHGCAAALQGLLARLSPHTGDRLVFLGDYVDRGPDSKQVIDTLLGLREQCDLITLMGNHEEMMLSVIEGRSPVGWWFRYGGRETLASYTSENKLSAVPDEHVDFLRNLQDFHEDERHFFVHANYVPDEPLDCQPVEALRWLSLQDRLPRPHACGKRAVVGHTSQASAEVYDAGHLICLDTYCHGGGWLTAMDMLSGEVWQVSREGVPRPSSQPRSTT